MEGHLLLPLTTDAGASIAPTDTGAFLLSLTPDAWAFSTASGHSKLPFCLQGMGTPSLNSR